MLTTEQKIQIWIDPDIRSDVRYITNLIAQFIISEPNYGLDYENPGTAIQQRVISYWQKRYSLANRAIQKPLDNDLLTMLMYKVVNGSFNYDSPITFPSTSPVYVPWDNSVETNGLAGFIKELWNDIAGVRSNEYPWAGENGVIQPPSNPNIYAEHFADLPNRF